MITRAKAKTAFSMGIKAAQIVDFLVTHAHNIVRDKTPIIPSNVVDQLVIWEAEQERIIAEEVVLLGGFKVPTLIFS